MRTETRLSSRQRGYTWEWNKAAALFRARNPLCVGCLAIGQVEPATIVDHIEPHKGNQSIFWCEANWQSCCGWHHNAIKPMLERMWFERKISIDDLRLDSPTAIKLSKSKPRKQTIGADGWPV